MKYVGGATETAYKSVSCSSPTVCVAVGSDTTDNPRIIRTVNGGASWSQHGKSISAPPGQALPTANELATVSCPDSRRCYAGGGGTGEVLISADGGTTWTYTPTLEGAGGVNDVSCRDALRCFAIVTTGESPYTSHVIIKTTDAGKSWAAVLTVGGVLGLSSISLYRVSCPSAQVCVAGGTGGGGTVYALSLYRTTDAGASWSRIGGLIGGHVTGLDCPTTAACVVTAARRSDASVLTTTDGGATFVDRTQAINTQVGGPDATLAAAEAVSCGDALHCTVVGIPATGRYGQPIIGTDDGGATWRVEAAPVPSPAGSAPSGLVAVSCHTTHTCAATGYPIIGCTDVACSQGSPGPGFVDATSNGGGPRPKSTS